MSFEIITDGASNLGKAIADKHNIHVIPFPYFIGGEEHASVNTDDYDDDAYFALLRDGVRVTTSQINPQRYMEYFEPLLQQGRDLLFIGIAGGISGSFASSQSAASELVKRYPQRKICTVNSLGASLGEGLLVLRAAEMRDSGMELEAVEAALNKLRMNMYQVFIVDDLMHLRRTGRVSNLVAAIGSMLGIRPLLKGSAEGTIVAFEKVRGKKQAIQALAGKYKTLHVGQDTVGISYCGCLDDAKYLIDLLKEINPDISTMLVKHEPATASHLGPGSLALYFFGGDDVRQH